MNINDAKTQPETSRFFNRERLSRPEFAYRVLIAAGILAAVALLLALLWQSTQVILLIFAGLLVAVFLRGIAERISRHTPLSDNWALGLLLLLIVGTIALAVWLLMPSLQHQYIEISQQLPQTIELLRRKLAEFSAGRWMLNQIPEQSLFLDNQNSNVFGRITGFFSSFFGIVVNVAIILMAGVYFAFNPNLYYEGAVKLFPQSRQPRVREILDTLGFNLRRWIVGRITVMTINGTLTALGLWFLGVPLAIPLGLLTAFFNFIPNIGPFLAAIPAVLIAFTQSPTQALYTAILFFIIQNLEGFVLTPLVQQKAVELPPVLIIAAQLLLGILFGFLGVVLAVPIVAVVFILVRMLYIEDLLGNETEVKGEQEAKEKQRDD
ncbi:MAG: AI-2E family transporter [Acidobacteriota bacterium]|nr:AI-2E family transporter [Acidobacteriota bacterium]